MGAVCLHPIKTHKGAIKIYLSSEASEAQYKFFRGYIKENLQPDYKVT